MIFLALGRWNISVGRRFIRRRILYKGYGWTPFVRVSLRKKRYVTTTVTPWGSTTSTTTLSSTTTSLPPEKDENGKETTTRVTVKRCTWKNIEHEVSGWDYWETSCGEGFCLADGTPQTFNMRFCPFCGFRIEQIEEEHENARNGE